MDGLMILGSECGCGKTVVTTGLAAALLANGFRTQAFKPVAFAEESALARGLDQQYMNKITQQYLQAETVQLASPKEFTVPLWNRMLEQCRNLPYPVLMEGPGQVATPWQLLNRSIVDGIDVAKQLNLPVLLVSAAGPQFIEKTRASLSFLENRLMTPAGFIRVQTVPGDPERMLAPDEPLLLAQQHSVPFWGDLPYSPSISVIGLQQGNLQRLTEENIDLLPLQMSIGLTL